MREGERDVGVIGEFAEPVSRDGLVELACGVFENGVRASLLYGKDEIRRVAICSGGGASGIEEAIRLGADAYITGEIKEPTAIAVEEASFNLLACGHHRTEIFGVRALAEKIQNELGIPAKFVDIDNPI